MFAAKTHRDSTVTGYTDMLNPGQVNLTAWLQAPTRFDSLSATNIWLDTRIIAAYASGASVLFLIAQLLLQRTGVIAAAGVPATSDQGPRPSSGVLGKLRKHFVQYGGLAIAVHKVSRVLVIAAQSMLAITSAIHAYGHSASISRPYTALAGGAVRPNLWFH